MTRRLNLADIQGNILRGFGMPVGRHMFVRIGDSQAGRAWLAAVADLVSSAEVLEEKPAVGVNVAFNAAGLTALGVPGPVLAGFSPEFRAGMASRADILSDHGASRPSSWRPVFVPPADGSQAPLALVSAYARTPAGLDSLVARLDGHRQAAGLAEGHALEVAVLEGGREHFGFADGFAQPVVAGWPAPPRSMPRKEKPLQAGEFLLGHRDGEYAIAPGPAGPLGRNSTYMVYRELAQDVAGFQRYLQEQADVSGLDPVLIAAKMVGRWPDGSPLTTNPDRPDPALAADSGNLDRLNSFGYLADSEGKSCPLGAHIRRVNPRDSLGFGLRMSRRHRMLRRGMPYVTDEGEKGLAFACFVASIHRQFEFVQAQWCNDGNAFGLGHEPDPLVGRTKPSRDEGTMMTVPGSPATFLSPLPDVVRTRGGEYLLLPSLSGLRALASLG